jgi:hypothetical protein
MIPTPLDINDLFTPAPSGVDPNNPAAVPAEDSWFGQLLKEAALQGLSTTSWQSGSMVRTILALAAVGLNQGDVAVSQMNQGGFLVYASAVTTDPSVTPGADPGPLDFVAWSEFGVLRDPATFATGTLVATNANASPFSYAAGAFHCSDPSTGATYHNVDAIVIAASTTTSFTIAADVAGSGSSAGVGTITNLTTSIPGVTISNPGQLVGSPAQSNAALVQTCIAKQAARSPDGPVGAYVFFALQASALLAAEELLNGDPIVVPLVTRARVITAPATGEVEIVIATADGDVPGATNLIVTGATNATPVEITTSTNHGLSTGDIVTVSGVRGNGGANVTSTITVTAANKFTLDGSAGTAAYVSGGVAEGGFLGQIDRIIQANTVPNGVLATTVSATSVTAPVVVDVWVPSSYAGTVSSTVTLALLAYFAYAPIGGFTDPGGAYTNVILLDAVIARVFASASVSGATYVQQARVTIDGVAADFAMTAIQVFVPDPITINVHPI